MNTNSQWCKELASAAHEYCLLIEDLERLDEGLLERLSRLLPRIHAAVMALDNAAMANYPRAEGPDLDRRFELYDRLHRMLGDRDGYLLEYDSYEDISGVSGSLADDFTDIYFELRKGLDLMSGKPDGLHRAVMYWYGGYLWHWGQHLVDAERHLYDLQVHRKLGPIASYSSYHN